MALFANDVAAKLDLPLDAIIQQRQVEEGMDMEHGGGGGGDAMDAEEGGNRRVYVGNLSFSTTWQELKDHMRQAGEVTHASVLQSPDGRSKGCGLVEFATVEAARDAIATLYDSQLNGRAIFVREDRERGGPPGGGHRGGYAGPQGQAARAGGGGGMPTGNPFPGRRVYVGNLAWAVAWQDLKDHMRSVGEVVHADILTSPDGRSKGCGIVEFASEDQARAAIAQLSDTMLKGRTIFVREDREAGNAPRGPPAAMNMGFNGGSMLGSPADPGLGTFGAGGPRPPTLGGTRVFVGNLSWDVTWQDLKDCMRNVGNVVRADVMVSNGKSKGCGIVEFSTPQEAQQAMATMADFNLKGRPIFVREDREPAGGGFHGGGGGGGYAQNGGFQPPAGGYANGVGVGGGGGGFSHGDAAPQLVMPHHVMPQAAPADAFDGTEGMNYAMDQSGTSDRIGRQLYVGNLSWGTNWQRLKDHFRTMGEVEYVEVATEPRGRSKGFGTVRYSTVEEAAAAIANLNESELDGRQITVRLDSYA